MSTDGFRDQGTYRYQVETSLDDTLRAQNFFLEKIAQALDKEFEPVKFLSQYGGDVTPGEIVRRYIVPIGPSTKEVNDGD